MTEQGQAQIVYATAPPMNALATAALVLGIAAHGIAAFFAILGPTPSPLGVIVFGWLPTLVPGLLALVFGIIGLTTATRLGGLRRGSAVWGIVLGITPMLTWGLGLVVRFFVFGPTASWFGS